MNNNNETIQKAITIAGSQEKLASLIGMSQVTIHKLLVRKSKGINLITASRISEATGIPLQEISDSYDPPIPRKLIKK